MTQIIRITTARAILDYINRPVSLAESQRLAEGAGEAKQRLLPGVVGRTRFRVMWELTPPVAQLLIERMDDALQDPELSAPLRAAIGYTKTQVEKQCAELFPAEGESD